MNASAISAPQTKKVADPSTTTPPCPEESLDTLRHTQTPAGGHIHSHLTPHSFPFGNLPETFTSSPEVKASVHTLIRTRHTDPLAEEMVAALLAIHDMIGTTLNTVSPNLFLDGKSRTPQEVLDMVVQMKPTQGGGKGE